jgi:hypothetical protein
MTTMTTQKTLKRRVRARAAKTGESYTAARAQLLRRHDAPAEPAPDAAALTGFSDEAMRRATGRPLAEWLGLLDAWGAREHRHGEIAAWLRTEHAVPGWWAQTITVGFERSRGMRARHQQADGFAVSASRTIGVSAERATDAFTDPSVRAAWLPDAPMRPRTATRGRSARFDWDEPPSRLVVGVVAKGEARAQVAVSHERLPDAETAERIKAMWRERLAALKEVLEGHA